MKLQYDTGPDKVKMGDYVFRRGETQEVPDGIAHGILNKQSVKFTIIAEESVMREAQDARRKTHGAWRKPQDELV